MKLYQGKTAPNARRVTIYLAEKGLAMETVDLDMRAGEHKTPAYLQKNPVGKVPLLELDDGGYLPESAAIVEFLEELHPTPSMIGETPLERAQVRASERIAADLMVRMAFVQLHSHPSVPQYRPGFVQYPGVKDALQESVDQMLDQLESRIGDNAFLAGSRPSVADCTLYALMERIYPGFGWELPERCPRLRAWYDRFRQRPSAQVA